MGCSPNRSGSAGALCVGMRQRLTNGSPPGPAPPVIWQAPEHFFDPPPSLKGFRYGQCGNECRLHARRQLKEKVALCITDARPPRS